ncbi:MAG: serine--tRNA ligase [Planctomycetota bacterium]
MIDLKQLRETPDLYRDGARRKGSPVDVDRVLELDEKKRQLQTQQEQLQAEQNKLAKEMGPQMGKLGKRIKAAVGAEQARLQEEMDNLKAGPAKLKADIERLDAEIEEIEPELRALLLAIPQPPDPDVPNGASSDDNIEKNRWSPSWFDPAKPFAQQRGFSPKSHIELGELHDLFDVERGVKIAGSRSYVLTGDGMRLHQAVLRYAFDQITRQGFRPMSVPVVVREEAMVGTGFFPGGIDQTYEVGIHERGDGGAAWEGDGYLAGTGEVGLMGLHMNEILDEDDLPLRYCTLSPCFRREAGAAGKDTAGLYRVHYFEKVEQVVICKADEKESRDWHRKMITYVANILQALELPYRLLQCCAGDLGQKNADMIDVECWMPSRGDAGADGSPLGAWGETHSASRLYDFQCRRLNLRYRPGGANGKGPTTFCHSLNNTVLASPRFLIPLLEMHQQADGSIKIPEPLRPYMNGQEFIGQRAADRAPEDAAQPVGSGG